VRLVALKNRGPHRNGFVCGTCSKLAIDNPVESFYYEATDTIAQTANAAALYG